jgi:hypothetical protein
MKFRAIAVGAARTGAVLLVATTAPGRTPAVGCQPERGKRIALTHDFRFTLFLGNSAEQMQMPYQVRAHHVKHGEVMLGGTMTGPAMLVGGPARHLEIQICAQASRDVVTTANPKIVVDDTTKKKAVTLPVAVMEDITVGDADLHYGNNIALPARHRFVVIVTWRGERATFHFIAPPVRR